MWGRWRAGIREGDERAIGALRRLMVAVADRSDELTAGEVAVLKRRALGDTNQQAADYLCLSLEGVKSRVKRACHKLGARNTVHAVALAYQQGTL